MSRLTTAATVACAVAMSIAPAKAQRPAADAAPAGPATRTFKSAGVSAVVTGMNVSNSNAQFQFIIKNDRSVPILISPIIFFGSQEMAATTTSGEVYVQQTIAGAASCNGLNTSVAVSVANCLKDFQASAMTRLEPGDITSLNVSYAETGSSRAPKEDSKISLVEKFIVRTAPPEEDSLETAAKGKTMGAPSIVTISFPLLPLGVQ